MFQFMCAAFGVMLLTAALLTSQTNDVTQYEKATANVTATNFWAYQRSVSNYLYAHPTATGTIPDSQLSFLLGYIRNTNWTNTVASGQLYVYSTVPMPIGTIASIGKKGGMALTIGTAKNHVMTSLNNGATGITLPTQITDGSVVAMGN